MRPDIHIYIMAGAKSYRGLTAEQVQESRMRHGLNVLTPPVKESLFHRFLGKFKDPLIIILLIAGLLSIAISVYEHFGLGQGLQVFFEPLGIFIAILLATGLAFLFEVQADKEFAILNKVNDDEPVRVIRDGNAVQVPKRDVVVGDIVMLSSGEEVPADGDLLESSSLQVDESTLTGEPICHKSERPEDFDPQATFPTNHLLRGTKVMEGHGVMEVDAVGDSTENGKVYVASQIDSGVKTPLNMQLDKLGRLISIASYLIGGCVVAGRLIMFFVNNGFNDFEWIPFLSFFLQTIMIAVTLIVVSVPEGLPMAVTLSLAYSMRRMLRTNNLVRKMHACETMGATTVICTDKTGTLTENQMRVHETDFYSDPNLPSGTDAEKVIEEGIAVNSTAMLDLSKPGKTAVLGNPTEGAILLWLRSNGVDYEAIRSDVKLLEELPFNTERKYMATVVESNALKGRRIVYVKGAPEIVLSLCGSVAGDMGRDEINLRLKRYQGQAMRTLGFAYRILDDGEEPIVDGAVKDNGLVFIGIVAISDPVRAEVPAAVRECLDAGIAIKIVTGDTPATACEIGRQIGLWNDGDSDKNITTGQELAAMSDEELFDSIDDIKIVARARPLDKKRLVETLQRKGHVVAVTGDGTNDAPALKAAHVGLSMGDGTSVAKEASDITIVDNSFASIGRAVMWGRSLYKNIQRFILFQMTVNVAACLIVLAGAFIGTESPLTVTQMLWVNLIMDTFAAMALASLPPSKAVMKEKPRDRNAFIITKSMAIDIIGTGLAFTALLLGLLYTFQHADVTSLRSLTHIKIDCPLHDLTPYELSTFFSIFVFLQFWNMFNARAFSTHRSAFHLKGCSEFLFIAAVILIGQILIVELGGEMFNVVPLRFDDWIIIVGFTSLVLWIGEFVRLFEKTNLHLSR